MVEPLSLRLEHVPEELALDFDAEHEPKKPVALQSAGLGALFLARASAALSPPEFTRPSTPGSQ